MTRQRQPRDDGDFLTAIAEVRPSITAAMLAEFASDSEQFARL